MDHVALHERARKSGVNPFVYWTVRALLQPLLHVYFRLRRIGREHIPASGPVIIAANHRSFLDPFVIATMTWRPMYYVAKKELFRRRFQAWILNSLGAFPVDRGAGDADTIRTAKELLERGEIVLIFPEGTRTRPGGLGKPHKGVGRLALVTGAPVVPIAVIGTESVRRGWRIRPHHVRIRAGRALQFPRIADASPQMAAAVTARIWPCVMLQWEWLGGTPGIRRAAIMGAGSWGTSLAVCLARAGFEVDLGCRTREQARDIRAAGTNDRHLPGVALPAEISVMASSELVLGAHDLVCLAVPARALPEVLAAHGDRIPQRSGLLVLCRGLVPPLGTLPSAFAAERTQARAVAVLSGPSHASEVLVKGSSVLVASLDREFARQLGETLASAGLDVLTSGDVTGVELASCAKSVAVLAAAAAASGGPKAAGAAAGKVFADCGALARARGCRPETFAGLVGAGDLVATAVAEGSRNERAGELLSRGVNAEEFGHKLGPLAEAVDTDALLARVARAAGIETPAIDGLLALVEGRIEPREWIEAVTSEARQPFPAVRA
jgi:1-acyl-sn-glycerol-3-phosphate acyltransferase